MPLVKDTACGAHYAFKYNEQSYLKSHVHMHINRNERYTGHKLI